MNIFKIEKKVIGYHEKYGWIHNVAHSSELVMSIMSHRFIKNLEVSNLIDKVITSFSVYENHLVDGEEKNLALLIVYSIKTNSVKVTDIYNKLFTIVKEVTQNNEDYMILRIKANISRMLSFLILLLENDNCELLNELQILISELEIYRAYLLECLN